MCPLTSGCYVKNWSERENRSFHDWWELNFHTFCEFPYVNKAAGALVLSNPNVSLWGLTMPLRGCSMWFMGTTVRAGSDCRESQSPLLSNRPAICVSARSVHPWQRFYSRMLGLDCVSRVTIVLFSIFRVWRSGLCSDLLILLFTSSNLLSLNCDAL